MELLGGVLSIIFVLIIFIIVLVAAYYATKLLAKRYSPNFSAGTGNIRVIDRVLLAQDKAVYIVKVANRILLLGVTPGGITNLCELNENEIDCPEKQETSDFSAILKNTIKDRFMKKGDVHDQR